MNSQGYNLGPLRSMPYQMTIINRNGQTLSRTPVFELNQEKYPSLLPGPLLERYMLGLYSFIWNLNKLKE